MIRNLGLFVAAVALILGLGQVASAQPLQAGAVALTVGDYLTIDGVTVTVDSASCSAGSTTVDRVVTLTACPSLYLAPDGPGPSVIVEAASGGTITPIMSYTCNTGSCSAGSYDMSVVLTATVAGTTAPLTSASVVVNGSATTNFNTDVGGTETLSGSETGCTTLAANVGKSASCDFSPVRSVTAMKDFGLTIDGLPDTVSLTLNSITETFATPEPASLACLLAGVIGLAAMRGRRRRV
jgi:hypothetical protein